LTVLRVLAFATLVAAFGCGGTAAGATTGTVAIDSSGKLLVAGNTNCDGHGSCQSDFFLARYNADGSLDTGFGKGGEVITGFGPGGGGANAVAIEPSGKIVVVGSASRLAAEPNHPSRAHLYSRFALARYRPDGALDKSFGHGGTLTTRISGTTASEGEAVRLDAKGRIVVAGTAQFLDSRGLALARYEPDGSLELDTVAADLLRAPVNPGPHAASLRRRETTTSAPRTDSMACAVPEPSAHRSK
jgi:uncharacterized delta-60 repeat protein